MCSLPCGEETKNRVNIHIRHARYVIPMCGKCDTKFSRAHAHAGPRAEQLITRPIVTKGCRWRDDRRISRGLYVFARFLYIDLRHRPTRTWAFLGLHRRACATATSNYPHSRRTYRRRNVPHTRRHWNSTVSLQQFAASLRRNIRLFRLWTTKANRFLGTEFTEHEYLGWRKAISSKIFLTNFYRITFTSEERLKNNNFLILI